MNAKDNINVTIITYNLADAIKPDQGITINQKSEVGVRRTNVRKRDKGSYEKKYNPP